MLNGIKSHITATINMRAAPLITAPIVATAKKGESITVYPAPRYQDERYTWLAVVFNGVPGYQALVNPIETQYAPLAALPRLTNPCRWQYVITNPFNALRPYGLHEGVDFAPIKMGCNLLDYPIIASAAGVVERVDTWVTLKARGALTNAYGISAVIRHDELLITYAHMSALSVCAGQSVNAGDVIGIIGTSGNSTGYHLHYHIQRPGKGRNGYILPDIVDPLELLNLPIDNIGG